MTEKTASEVATGDHFVHLLRNERVLPVELQERLHAVKLLLAAGDNKAAMDKALASIIVVDEASDFKTAFSIFREAFLEALIAFMSEEPCWKNNEDRWRKPFHDFLCQYWAQNAISFEWLKPIMRAKHRLYRPMFLRALHDYISEVPGRSYSGYLFLMRNNLHHGAFDLLAPIADVLYPQALENDNQEVSFTALDWCLLGDTLLMIQRTEDAEHCYRQAVSHADSKQRAVLGLAAVKLDQGLLSQAASLANKAADMLALGKHKPLAHTIRSVTNIWRQRKSDAQPKSIEIVIFCHCHQKLKKNSHLGPPGVGLMEEALDSLEKTIGFPDGARVTIFYDHRDTPLNDSYYKNLQQLSSSRGIKLIRNTGNGLRKQWLHAFSIATSDVVLVLEQDHIFNSGCPSYQAVLDTFAGRADIIISA